MDPQEPANPQGAGTSHPQQQPFIEQMQALLQALQLQGGPMDIDRRSEKMPELLEFDGSRGDWEN